MATAPLEIYEINIAQEVVLRLDGVHLISAREALEEDFQADWADLVATSEEPNPFFEPWYLLPSLVNMDIPGRVQIAAYYRAGILCGLFPLIKSTAYYGYPLPHYAVWQHPNMFSGAPLVRRGHALGFWRTLLATLDEEPGGALFLHLPQLNETGPINRALEVVLASQDRAAGIVHRSERALLQSNLGPEAYFEASLSAKKRKELRRQERRLGEEGCLTFERQHGSANLDHWIGEFLGLEASGWKGAEGSALASATASARLFNEALTGAAHAGKLERLTLRLGGKPIAMLANFLTPPGAFSFKTAFDERYARFSPGVLLQQRNLELLSRSDIAWCDSCAAEGHPMIERIWREKHAIISRSIAIGGSLRRRLFEPILRAETKKESRP
ncbi:MAG: GNAT family N-acetyltransferase [Alphaproteobacteria bacterium]|nr:MAG: GNAT family N-acetyltransferase [Alphaproteobacteria bacterium]